MTASQQIMTIMAVALATIITRFLPFIAFPAGRSAPKYITFLGKALPGAVFGMLVIFCLKNVSLLSGSHGIPEFVSIFAVIILHLWKRNMLLSIAGGTAVYMLVINLVF